MYASAAVEYGSASNSGKFLNDVVSRRTLRGRKKKTSKSWQNAPIKGGIGIFDVRRRNQGAVNIEKIGKLKKCRGKSPYRGAVILYLGGLGQLPQRVDLFSVLGNSALPQCHFTSTGLVENKNRFIVTWQV